MFRIFALVASTLGPGTRKSTRSTAASGVRLVGLNDVLSLFASSTAHRTMSSLTPPHIATSRPARAASSPAAPSQRQTPQSNTIRRLVGQTLRNAPAADPTSSRTPGPLSRTHEPDSTVNLILMML